jgi:ribosomal protein L16/L10AE
VLLLVDLILVQYRYTPAKLHHQAITEAQRQMKRVLCVTCAGQLKINDFTHQSRRAN